MSGDGGGFVDPFTGPTPKTPSPPSRAPAKPSGYDAALEDARRIYKDPKQAPSLNALSGALFGAGPEIEGLAAEAETGVNNIIDGIQHKHPKYTAEEARKAMTDASVEALKKYGKDHPLASIATDLAGGFMTPGLGAANDAMKLRKIPGIIRAMGIGGTLGAGRSFFDSRDKPLGERAAETAEGATGGALTGGALHGAGYYAGKAAKAAAPSVKSVLASAGSVLGSHSDNDAEQLAKRVAKGEQIGRKEVAGRVAAGQQRGVDLTTSAAEKSGKDVTAAEALGRHDVARVGSAARHEGPAGDTLVARMQARNEESGTRLADTVSKVAGLDKDAIEGDFEATNARLRAKAKPLYDAWHSETGIDSPELAKVRETPAFKKAMAKAAEIIANEHGNAVEEGLAPSDLPLEWKGKVMKDSSGKPIMVPREQALSHAQSSGTPHSMAAEIEQPPLPTAKGYDYVKRGFDALINEHKDKVTGRIDFSNPDVKALTALRGELNDALTDTTKPWGASAKAAFAAGGEAPMQKEAFDAAEDVMQPNVSDHDFDKRISRFNPSQMDALKAGLANMFRDQSRSGKVNLSRYLTPNGEYKIKKILGQQAGQAVIDDMRLEQKMTGDAKAMTRKAIEARDTETDWLKRQGKALYHLGVAGSFIGGSVLGHEPIIGVGAIYHLVKGVSELGGSFLETTEGKAANNEVVRLLSLKPSELAAELKASGMDEKQASKTMAFLNSMRDSKFMQTLAGRAGGMAAATGVNLVSPDAKKKPAALDADGFVDPFTGPSSAPNAQEPQGASYNPESPPPTSNEAASRYLEDTLGVPITITSGYRDPVHNAEVGGSQNSAHMEGDAWDFQPHGMSMEDAGYKLAHSGMPFDQIEITPDHVHVSFDPQMRHEVIHRGFGGRKEGGPSRDPAPGVTVMDITGHPELADVTPTPAVGERPFQRKDTLTNSAVKYNFTPQQWSKMPVRSKELFDIIASSNGDPTPVLKNISQFSANKHYRDLASKLIKNGLGRADIKNEPQEYGTVATTDVLGSGKDAFSRISIDFNNPKGLTEETLLHEALHAYVTARYGALTNSGVIENSNSKINYKDNMKAEYQINPNDNRSAYGRLIYLWDTMGNAIHRDGLDKKYVWAQEIYRNPDEALSWVMTDPDAQNYLKNHHIVVVNNQPTLYKNTADNMKDTGWDHFVRSVKGFLGNTEISHDALSDVLNSANSLLDSGAKDPTDFSLYEKAQN